MTVVAQNAPDAIESVITRFKGGDGLFKGATLLRSICLKTDAANLLGPFSDLALYYFVVPATPVSAAQVLW